MSGTLTETFLPNTAPIEILRIQLQRSNSQSSGPDHRVKLISDSPHPSDSRPTSTRSRLGRVEPSLYLQPTRKRLSSIEAQRLMAVVTEMVRRTAIVALLPNLMVWLDNMKVCMGVDLVKLLEHHARLMDSFDELEEQRHGSSGVSRPLASEGQSRGSSGGRRQVTSGGKQRSHSSISSRVLSADVQGGRSTCLSSANRPRSATGVELAQQFKPQENIDLDRQGSSVKSSTIDAAPDSIKEIMRSEDESRELDMPGGIQQAAVIPGDQLGDMHIRQKMQLRITSVMRDSCRSILRSFAVNPSAAMELYRSLDWSLLGISDLALIRSEREDMSEGQGWMSSEGGRLIRELAELREFVLVRLLTTPLEVIEKRQYERELMDKDRYNSEINQKLAAELQAAEDELENEVKQKNEVIRKLQAELHQIDKNSEDTIRRTRQEAEKQEAAEKKMSESNQSKLQAELNQIRTQYNSLLAEHRDKEMVLRKRKFQVETEVENWVQRFDTDMGERQDEYDQIDFVYTEEKKQLTELEERFRALETEYLQIMAARQASREAREASERELQMCVRAATTIQAFWRSFKVRKAIKNKKKKSKSGVKQGKKGKK